MCVFNNHSVMLPFFPFFMVSLFQLEMSETAKRLKKWILRYLSNDCPSLVRQVAWDSGDHVSISTIIYNI